MGMMDKLLDAMKLNPDEDFDDDELDEEYDFYDDDDEEYDIPSGPSERELRRQKAAEEKAAKKEAKRRDRGDDMDAEDERIPERGRGGEPSRSNSRKAGDDYVYNKKAERASRSSKITPISGRSSARPAAGNGWVVRIIKPTSVDDEVEIVDTLLEGRTVIINMEGFDLAIAQRIIDFTIGATYAMGGDLQRISNYIFLATPPGVDISGDISNIKEQYNEDEDDLN